MPSMLDAARLQSACEPSYQQTDVNRQPTRTEAEAVVWAYPFTLPTAAMYMLPGDTCTPHDTPGTPAPAQSKLAV